MAQVQSYPTIWEIPDDLWEAVKILLQEYDPPAVTGRPRDDRRPILNAIIHRFRTGCQWNRLPKEFGDDSKIIESSSIGSNSKSLKRSGVSC